MKHQPAPPVAPTTSVVGLSGVVGQPDVRKRDGPHLNRHGYSYTDGSRNLKSAVHAQHDAIDVETDKSEIHLRIHQEPVPSRAEFNKARLIKLKQIPSKVNDLTNMVFKNAQRRRHPISDFDIHARQRQRNLEFDTHRNLKVADNRQRWSII